MGIRLTLWNQLSRLMLLFLGYGDHWLLQVFGFVTNVKTAEVLFNSYIFWYLILLFLNRWIIRFDSNILNTVYLRPPMKRLCLFKHNTTIFLILDNKTLFLLRLYNLIYLAKITPSLAFQILNLCSLPLIPDFKCTTDYFDRIRMLLL